MRRIPANTIMSLKREVTAVSLYFKYPFIRIAIERGGLRVQSTSFGWTASVRDRLWLPSFYL